MSHPAHKQHHAPGAKALAPAAVSLAEYNQASRDVASLSALLERASRDCHLVSPATSIGALPEGFVIVTSAVLVDMKAETYAVGGSFGDEEDSGGHGKDNQGAKRGLSKIALDRIALAAGVSWDPHLSRRIDDGKDPRYCAWLAVGRYQNFDGRECIVQASKEVDLRDHSPQVDALWARYEQRVAQWEGKRRQGPEPRTPDAQIREQRLHIVSLAETKARLRAIRALGIRTSYTVEELRKPFVIAKLALTGATSDPALRRDLSLMVAANFLDSRSKLYGEQRPALPPPTPAPTIAAEVICEYCGADEDVETIDAPAGPVHHCGAPRCQQLARADAAREPAASAPQASYPGLKPDPTPASSSGARPPAVGTSSPTPAAGADGRSQDVKIPFGRNAGLLLGEVDDDDLKWLRSALARSLSDPGKAKFKASNQQLLDHVLAEQKRRSGEAIEPDACGSDNDEIPY